MAKNLELICQEIELETQNNDPSFDDIIQRLGLSDQSEFAIEAYKGFVKEYSKLRSWYLNERRQIESGRGYGIPFTIGLAVVGSFLGAYLSEGSATGLFIGMALGTLIGYKLDKPWRINYRSRNIEPQILDLNNSYQSKKAGLIQFYTPLTSSK